MIKTSVETERADGSSANPLPNGYYKLPPGKLANACTYLEMLAPPASARPPAPEGVHLARLAAKDAVRFLELYRAIGEMWLWAGHLRKGGGADCAASR